MRVQTLIGIASVCAIAFANSFAPAQADSGTWTAGRPGSSRTADAELLTATYFKAHHRCARFGPEPRPYAVSFSARGTATGVYPGTFVTTGNWYTFSRPVLTWVFNESFTITSGSLQISGSIAAHGNGNGPSECLTFGPADLKYSTTGARGKVTVEIGRQSFQATLHGL